MHIPDQYFGNRFVDDDSPDFRRVVESVNLMHLLAAEPNLL